MISRSRAQLRLTIALTCVLTALACADDGVNRWPDDTPAYAVDTPNVLGGNVSGLMYEASNDAGAPDALWAVRNGPGSLLKLVSNGTAWIPDDVWGHGRLLLYPDGTGNPDAEGVTFAETGARSGIYVAAEQDNNDRAMIRNSVLRFDVNTDGTTLTATDEWNLTAGFTTLPNQGLEGITWIPDSYLVAAGLNDESTGRIYNPSDYPAHGSGLFFVGVETNGMIAGYALRPGGTFNRISTGASGLPGVMELHFDRETHDLWAVCDARCNGQAVVLRIDPHVRKFVEARRIARPESLPNIENEGFALTPLSECAGNRRPVFWADDSATSGQAIRRGMVPCTPVP